MTKKQTIQMLESIEERCADFPYMTAQDWVTIAAAKRHLNECIYKEMMEEAEREEPVSKDLEEEINKFVDIPENQGNPDLKEELSKCAHHFAQWQKQQDEEDISDMLVVTYLRGGNEGKKIMVDKACEVIKKMAEDFIDMEYDQIAFVESFRKAIEE